MSVSTLFSFGINVTSLDLTHVAENYLLALCESDRKKELLQVLEIVDITKLSPPNLVANIFKSLGRLLLESFAEQFLFAFKTCGMFVEYHSLLFGDSDIREIDFFFFLVIKPSCQWFVSLQYFYFYF
jgi:hypothetical protein